MLRAVSEYRLPRAFVMKSLSNGNYITVQVQYTRHRCTAAVFTVQMGKSVSSHVSLR
jgi:hypothetical protein